MSAIMKRRLILLASIALLFSSGTINAADTAVKVDVIVDSQHPGYEGYRAMDGNPGTMWHSDFSMNPPTPHEIIVDLGKSYEIAGFTYLPRPGGTNGTIADYECYVSDDRKKFGDPIVKGKMPGEKSTSKVAFTKPVTGRYFRIRALKEIDGRAWTSIAELTLDIKGVKLVAKESSIDPGMTPFVEPKDELEMQYITLLENLRNRSQIYSYAPQTFNEQALILPEDKTPLDIVIRRTRALIADIRSMVGAPNLDKLAAELDAIEKKAGPVEDLEAEPLFEFFVQACKIRRQVAMSNPLLDFDRLLFIKRHRSTFNHMCDQYYGINTLPGGSVYALENPFSEDPAVTDLLADSIVESGRLEGESLAGGSFLAPDLSFDGKQIAFAYVECVGDRGHDHHTDPSRGHWDPGRCYHIFTANTDGTNLKQLTDGTWNDFDPFYLPNGRIGFISERRGGYLRCGRVCPTYTLFDMAADGSQIDCLSYHETNEWHPSVAHDRRILYTRWDYIDRHGCTVHFPWITTPDGRDSRAVHGNFSPRRERADMELDVRTVPGSHKFIATAAPHHGQAFGSLIMIDPRIEDDDGMAPVKRLTPEIKFPESQGGSQVYGTPWALNENYYLCVYDATMKPGVGRQGQRAVPGRYGIYLIDAFGNKELIYRDPTIACQSPMPLRSRPMPPRLPEHPNRKFSDKPYVHIPSEEERPEDATCAVMNVYKSLRPLPEGTKVKEIRVLHMLPMSVPSGPRPHETGPRFPSARDSVNLCRFVLGTAPVEEDGSAHFIVPAHKEIVFQLIDEDGLAVQSMRSSTYLQEGDNLVCTGCHEPKSYTPERIDTLPAAMLRPASKLKPDVSGSNPYSYPLLVQPVLDKHCVECHRKEDKAPTLEREPYQNNWYASYNTLVHKHGFWNYGESLRTTPGRFGARASNLYKMLKEGHHDVKLSEEDMHRITLWLDCCSLFYGVYEKEGGQAQLRGEVVYPTLE